LLGNARSRVSLFMSKSRSLGYIETDHGLKINRSLLSVVLHD